MSQKIWLGADDTGAQVLEPIGHLAVFGQTRRAGKTTTLRTLIGGLSRDAGASAMVFRTGRGEIHFPGASASTPFFREHLDWQNVEAMLWTHLNEKPKTYRPIIMRAVHGARSLEDVHRNIVSLGKKSKNGWVVDRTYELDTYFQEILPWLRSHQLGSRVELRDGVSVVELEGWPETVQQLVISSTLNLLLEQGRRRVPLLVVIPEARSFVPDDRATPVRLAADRVARMGAKLNLFLWIDSQSLTGVDQQLLRNFALLLQGVQTSDLEVKRICAAFDNGVTPSSVQALRVGDFLLHTESGVRKIHVPLPEGAEAAPSPPPTSNDGASDRPSGLEEENERLRGRVQDLEETVRSLRDELASRTSERSPDPAVGTEDDPRERIDLHVTHEVPNLTVHVREVRLEATTEENSGRAALLISQGWFDNRRSVREVIHEFIAHRWGGTWSGGAGWNNMDRILGKLAEQGFLRAADKGYVAVPEAKARIRTVQERA